MIKMTRQIRLLGSILAILAIPMLPAMAQDDIDDLFGELDKIEVSADSLAGKTVLSQLKTNAGGKLTIRGQHFLKDPETILNREVSKNPDLVESRLDMSTWTGGSSWRFSVAGWLDGGNEKRIWRGYTGFNDFLQNESNYRHHIELNECYLRLYRSKFDLTAGKMIFKNGVCPIYSPADRYGPADFNDPIESRELGTWLGQVDLFVKNTTITGIVFPVYQTTRIPGQRSRWMSTVEYGYDPDKERIPIAMREVIPEEEMPPVTADNMGYLVRLKTTFSGWDVFASGFYGLNSQDVYRGVEKTVKIPTPDVWSYVDVKTYDATSELVKVGHGAAGFATTYKKLEFHGEGVYNHTFKSKDDNFVSYVTGFSYNFGDIVRKLRLNGLRFYLDYAGEHVTKEQSAKGYVISSRNARFGGKDFLIGENDMIAYLAVTVNDDLGFHLISLKQLSKNGHYNRIMGSYNINDSMTCSLACDMFNGSENSFIGRWSSNDRVTVLFEYHL